jgi:hypothetical protein
MADIEKIRNILGKNANGISDEKLLEFHDKFANTAVGAIEKYEKDTYGITLRELMEGTEKDRFLKMFSYYSDKFVAAIPIDIRANIDWRIYSDDFAEFVKTGKLSSSKLDKE